MNRWRQSRHWGIPEVRDRQKSAWVVMTIEKILNFSISRCLRLAIRELFLRLFRIWSPLIRIVHEPPATTADIAVLPGVLGTSFDRLRTSSPCDVLKKYASGPSPCVCPVARPSPRSRYGVSCIMRVRWDLVFGVLPEGLFEGVRVMASGVKWR